MDENEIGLRNYSRLSIPYTNFMKQNSNNNNYNCRGRGSSKSSSIGNRNNDSNSRGSIRKPGLASFRLSVSASASASKSASPSYLVSSPSSSFSLPETFALHPVCTLRAIPLSNRDTQFETNASHTNTTQTYKCNTITHLHSFEFRYYQFIL